MSCSRASVSSVFGQNFYVFVNSSLCRSQTQVKALSSKEGAIAKADLKLTEAKRKTVLWSDKSKFENLFWDTAVLFREVTCYQYAIENASLMMWGYINAPSMQKSVYRLQEHVLPDRQWLFQGRLCLFQQDNKPQVASITTAWLHGRRVQMMNWHSCSPDLSPNDIWYCIKLNKLA